MIKELLKADEIKVALVAAACIIGSALIFKRVLNQTSDTLLSRGPGIILIIYLITRGVFATRRKEKTKGDSWLYWSLAIIFITVLDIMLHVV